MAEMAEILMSHRSHRSHRLFNVLQSGVDKNQKNSFRCLELLQSSCAKRSVLVFESELSRQPHTPYHITALLQTSKSKNTASLKNIV